MISENLRPQICCCCGSKTSTLWLSQFWLMLHDYDITKILAANDHIPPINLCESCYQKEMVFVESFSMNSVGEQGSLARQRINPKSW